MRNYLHSSTFRRFSKEKSGKWTIFTVAIIVMILWPVLPCYAEDKKATEILEEASRNIEKYRKGEASISFTAQGGKPIKDAEVVIEQKSHDFLFGNIIFPVVGVLGKFEDIDVYRPELFKQRFKDVFNMAIFPFYWSSYEEIPGREDWDKIVPIVEWCKLNYITPKGHPLAWVERGGTPRWLYDLPTDLTEDLLKSRITRIVKGFKGQIDIWDVVNEPTHTITWSSVQHADNYVLEEAINPSFLISTVVYNGPNTSFDLTNKAEGSYYYRVRAYSSCTSSQYNMDGYVYVCYYPDVPAFITYPSSDCDGSFQVSWSGVSGAQNYYLQRSPYADFSNLVATLYTGTNTYYNESGLTNGNYYYRVRAERTCGEGSWKTGEVILVTVSQTPPEMIDYPSTDDDGAFIVTWNQASGSTSYTLRRADNPSFSSENTCFNVSVFIFA